MARKDQGTERTRDIFCPQQWLRELLEEEEDLYFYSDVMFRVLIVIMDGKQMENIMGQLSFLYVFFFFLMNCSGMEAEDQADDRKISSFRRCRRISDSPSQVKPFMCTF